MLSKISLLKTVSDRNKSCATHIHVLDHIYPPSIRPCKAFRAKRPLEDFKERGHWFCNHSSMYRVWSRPRPGDPSRPDTSTAVRDNKATISKPTATSYVIDMDVKMPINKNLVIIIILNKNVLWKYKTFLNPWKTINCEHFTAICRSNY